MQQGNKFGESPRPLHRFMPSAPIFPVDALGDILSSAARAITAKIQCPLAISGLSVLGAASLSVQGHANVVIPATSHVQPTSLFLITVAASGERKSAADREALCAIRAQEKALHTQYAEAQAIYENHHMAWSVARNTIKTAKGRSVDDMANTLQEIGAEPQPPLSPMLLCTEPTFEGLCRQYKNGYPILGLFSDEGGQFIGGHGMRDENRLRMATGLCSLWDGSPIKRVRVDDGCYVLYGKRLAAHLMMQPDVASILLSDAALKDQGLLSRMLVSYPESTMGTRLQTGAYQSNGALERYNERLTQILQRKLPLALDTTNELQPRNLEVNEQAKQLWFNYANYIESNIASNTKYETIRGLANKLPEHSLRIAGVLTLIENVDAQYISYQTLYNGTLLAEYFASEALRLFDAGTISQELRDAENLRAWLYEKWDKPYIPLRDIYQRGPNRIRNAKTAKHAAYVLEQHGWLHRIDEGMEIDGKSVKDIWLIHGKTMQSASPANHATVATNNISAVADLAMGR
jgi:hypothetical protein